MVSKKLAQNIVKRMMEVIPYNVNIMNDKGIIIGSGDLNRIGNIHEGALKALKSESIVEVSEDTKEIKAGVNIPILFREKVVGVIGITGMPEIVRPFGKLVSITAELLISQEYSLNEHVISQKLIEEFIYEWINYKRDYDEDFIQRAKSLGIDILIERIVVSIEYNGENLKKCDAIIGSILGENEYTICISTNRRIILFVLDKYSKRKIGKLKEKLSEFNGKIGISNSNKIIVNSVRESLKALDIGSKIYSEKNTYKYEEIAFFDQMQNLFKNKSENKVIEKILEEGKGIELLETFLVYMEMNGERSNVAKKIHIHRNTLNYRLEKIEEITGLKFDNFIELFQLMRSYIQYKLIN